MLISNLIHASTFYSFLTSYLMYVKCMICI
nr:MAG TPA: hypothetical protein [Caudoviricetes sp.]